MGCTNQAGEDNRNVARMASLIAGLPPEVPGVTVNRLCASGLEAVVRGRAARSASARPSCVLAGGVESMSRAPLVMLKPERGFPRGNGELVDTTIGWRFANPRLAETLLDRVDGRDGRERRGAVRHLARGSGRVRARLAPAGGRAARHGRFDDEIVDRSTSRSRRATPVDPLTRDEGPRPDTTLERLATLKPVFQDGAPSRPATPRQINDGAACGRDRARSVARARARPLGVASYQRSAGVDPAVMGDRPSATPRRRRSSAAGSRPTDIDLVELNEAFASQVLACHARARHPTTTAST